DGVRDLLPAAAAAAADALRADGADVVEFDDTTGLPVIRASVRDGLPTPPVTIADDLAALARRALASPRSAWTWDRRNETDPAVLRALDALGAASLLAVGVAGTRRPFGLLIVHTRSPRVFDAGESGFLSHVAGVVADSVERRRAEDALRRSEERFREMA